MAVHLRCMTPSIYNLQENRKEYKKNNEKT